MLNNQIYKGHVRAQVKIPKNRNRTFNDIKNLMFKELNTPQVQ
jgi:hypothetical protein